VGTDINFDQRWYLWGDVAVVGLFIAFVVIISIIIYKRM
jgi:hypothetical protein